MAKKKPRKPPSPSSVYKRIKRRALKKPLSPQEKQKYLEGMAKKMDRKKTKPEIIFEELMKELEIEYETQIILGGKIFDFYLPKLNTIVEVDGDYWHGVGLELNEMNGMQRRSVKNDAKKNIIAISFGYKIERVIESELEKNYNEIKKKFEEMKNFL